MAVEMRNVVLGVLGDLRVHPVGKWVRASSGKVQVVSSKRAKLVWEPRRVVPSYAVPREDVQGELVPYTGQQGAEHPLRIGAERPSVLTPDTSFSVHTTPGTPLTIRAPHRELAGAAFAPEDSDLDGYVILDWDAFEHWYEEDQPVLGHPHDPFDRIDCLRSSRHVVVSSNGDVLADTRRATMLFETPLPVRYYIPRSDVRMALLEPSDHRTVCAYKGVASYWSADLGDGRHANVAWSYEQPLHDAVPVRDLVSFFTERLDLTVDGERIPRPITPWS